MRGTSLRKIYSARHALVAVGVVAATSPLLLRAQSAPMRSAIGIGSPVLLGSEAEERLRLESLRRRATAAERESARDLSIVFSTVRSASVLTSLARPRAPRRFAFDVLAPEVRMVHNSGLPFSINEGPLWAARGTNTIATAGVALRIGPLSAQIAPQYIRSENRRFQVIPYPQGNVPARNVWANPFHPPASSIDLPLRFGDGPIERVVPGQSRVALELPLISVGASTENVWWGPTLRNPILLGANAEGFPHLLAETRQGIATPVGRLHAVGMLGRLRESAYFDANPSNDVRSLSGMLFAWTPWFDQAFTIGVARLVMSTTTGQVPIRHAANAFLKVSQPILSDPNASVTTPRRDQIATLFARYAIPSVGTEAWAEWARFAEPVSLRDALEYPGYSFGFTAGLQWARPLGGSRLLRLQGEATNLEPDASIRVRPVATTYTSRTVLQGFTNGGRTIGAPIGPGSSSQWAAADILSDRIRIGIYGGRIRWDNATLWDPAVPQLKLEDVSLLGGVRGSVSLSRIRLGVEYTSAVRLSYLYQSKLLDPARGTNGGVDLANRTLAVTLSTAVGR
ncbi:MAG: hypothetical protein P3C09_03330 [Gemmatimonadota bacterium]|nr:hypothetical protein [Gemmatimonadota bacterium]MDQ8166771.1 hypothetical protein [Gemmatimonadota bacterium]